MNSLLPGLARGVGPASLPALADRLGRQRLENHEARRRQGCYYTPPALAFEAARLGLQELEALPGSVLDPACGSGVFLAVVHQLLCIAGMCKADASRCLYGTDTDREAVEICRMVLKKAGLGPKRAAKNVIESNSLVGPWPGPERYGLVIGNPPHLGEEDNARLLEKAAEATGLSAPRGDLSFHFTARALDLLEPGGVLALILPSSLVDADSASALRTRLVQESHVLHLVDLGKSAFGPGVLQPSVLLVVKKKAPGKDNERPLFHRITWQGMAPGLEDVVAVLKGKRHERAVDWHQEQPRHEAGRWPWLPQGRTGNKYARTTLKDRFKVNQGIVPGPARASFKLIAKLVGSRDPKSVQEWAGKRGFQPGEGVFVITRQVAESLAADGTPAELIRPFSRQSEIRVGNTGRYKLLYLTEKTCPDIRKYPALMAHLKRFRPIMERRRETRNGTRKWFHLHWPRKEGIFLGPKVLVPRQGKTLVAVFFDRPLFVDLGVNVITAGSQDELEALAEYLRSKDALDWFSRNGKVKAGMLQLDAGVLYDLALPRHF